MSPLIEPLHNAMPELPDVPVFPDEPELPDFPELPDEPLFPDDPDDPDDPTPTVVDFTNPLVDGSIYK